MEGLRTIRRVLVVGADEASLEAVESAADAHGLMVRHAANAVAFEAALQGFGPDAVILDSQSRGRAYSSALPLVSSAGAALILLGGPDDPRTNALRREAERLGIEVAGILPRPLVPEGVAAALRALTGALRFSAGEIAGAMMRGEMTAWYQLQLRREAAGWTPDGAEALARWQHPEHGLVLPDAFVPVAEAQGHIAAITDCVLQTAIEQLGAWQRVGLTLRVGVNLSPLLVEDVDFPQRLARLLGEYDVPTRCLVLEIPESAMAQAPGSFIGLLARLRIEGFGVALEHFGGGISSVADLYRTPFSELKIDRALVTRLDEDEDAQRLVCGIIALARELGLATAAEAVPSREALEFLHSAGCDRVQGYVISRPLPAAEFQTLVGSWR